MGLHVHEGRLNCACYYDEIVMNGIVPHINVHLDRHLILVQAYAPIHKAIIITNANEQHGVRCMAWAANSPCVSVIDHVLDIVGRAIQQLHVSGMFDGSV